MFIGNLAISTNETHGFASRPHDRFAFVLELNELQVAFKIFKYRHFLDHIDVCSSVIGSHGLWNSFVSGFARCSISTIRFAKTRVYYVKIVAQVSEQVAWPKI